MEVLGRGALELHVEHGGEPRMRCRGRGELGGGGDEIDLRHGSFLSPWCSRTRTYSARSALPSRRTSSGQTDSHAEARLRQQMPGTASDSGDRGINREARRHVRHRNKDDGRASRKHEEKTCKRTSGGGQNLWFIFALRFGVIRQKVY